MFVRVCVCVSVEKDGSTLTDERQTVQILLFDLLSDFLSKSPTVEELHSVLAYATVVQEQQQVCDYKYYIITTYWCVMICIHICARVCV